MYALIKNGEIISKLDVDLNPAPNLATNKGKWIPIIARGDMPDYDPNIEICEPSEVIGSSEITEGWTVRNLSSIEIDIRKMAIKAEARSRIVALYPEWKQANMTARSVELIKIKVDGGTWTVQETAEAAALDAVWDWIKTVREASDDLELDPPSDFTDNAYWPSNP